jgi:hypothetical protein
MIVAKRKSGKIAWAITKDILEPTGKRNATDEQLKEVKKDCKHHFKLYDDDGELYYEGYSDDDSSFSPLDWAMADSGCTEIKYRTASGKYETL